MPLFFSRSFPRVHANDLASDFSGTYVASSTTCVWYMNRFVAKEKTCLFQPLIFRGLKNAKVTFAMVPIYPKEEFNFCGEVWDVTCDGVYVVLFELLRWGSILWWDHTKYFEKGGLLTKSEDLVWQTSSVFFVQTRGKRKHFTQSPF